MKRLLIVPLILAAAAAGCEKDKKIVDFTVGWTIGLEPASAGICSRAGIGDVYVVLDSAGETLERKMSCGQGQIKFEGIAERDYDAKLSGLNGDGCPIYYAEAEVAASRLEAGLEVLRLESVPATGDLEIGWWFTDARFCGFHGVETVTILVFRDDVQILDEDVDCDQGSFSLEDALIGRYSIRMEAQSNEGLLCREYHDLTLDPCGVIAAQDALTPCD